MGQYVDQLIKNSTHLLVEMTHVRVGAEKNSRSVVDEHKRLPVFWRNTLLFYRHCTFYPPFLFLLSKQSPSDFTSTLFLQSLNVNDTTIGVTADITFLGTYAVGSNVGGLQKYRGSRNGDADHTIAVEPFLHKS